MTVESGSKAALSVGARALFVLAAFWVASDALVVRCVPFWLQVSRSTTSASHHPVHLEAALRMTPPGNLDMALVGNSVLARAVDVPTLAGALKVDESAVQAFALRGASDLELLMISRWLLELRPRAIVYFTSVETLFERQDALADARFYDPIAAWRLFGPADWLKQYGQHLGGVLLWSHVLYRQRNQIVEALGAPLARFAWAETSLANRQRRERQEFFEREGTRRQAEAACPNLNVRAIEAFAERARVAGTGFVVLAAPLNAQKDRREDVRRQLDRCLQAAANEHGFAYIPRRAFRHFSAADFSDRYHLNAEGQAKFMRQLLPLLRGAHAF